MFCTLIVTTYNWPAALDLALVGIRSQSRLPDEVIVADDGSGAETAALMETRARDFPIPLRHVWQEDLGFRAARARNLALAAARGDYVLFIDGDIIPHREFVADHLWAAKRGCFVQGVRLLTGPDAGARMLAERRTQLGWRLAGVSRRRHAVRSRLLARFALAATEGQRRAGIKTCNQGWWRDDLQALNGFDERFVGWGREDDDLAVRAFNAGLRRRSLRFAGLAIHLHHPERHHRGTSANDALLAESVATGATRCQAGIDGHRGDSPSLHGLDQGS